MLELPSREVFPGCTFSPSRPARTAPELPRACTPRFRRHRRRTNGGARASRNTGSPHCDVSTLDRVYRELSLASRTLILNTSANSELPAASTLDITIGRSSTKISLRKIVANSVPRRYLSKRLCRRASAIRRNEHIFAEIFSNNRSIQPSRLRQKQTSML